MGALRPRVLISLWAIPCRSKVGVFDTGGSVNKLQRSLWSPMGDKHVTITVSVPEYRRERRPIIVCSMMADSLDLLCGNDVNPAGGACMLGGHSCFV